MNEIYATHDEGNTLYALIWRKTDDKIWNNTDSQFDTYTDADIDKYDVVLANQVDSDYYSVDFPAAITGPGVYRIQIMLQPGAIDADADFGLFQGELYWDGTAELDMFTLNTQIEDDVIGATGDTLESLSDQLGTLQSSQNKVHNILGPGE